MRDQGANPAVVLTRAVLKAASALGLGGDRLGIILGLNAPDIAQMQLGQTVLDPATPPYERAILLIRIFRALNNIVGGEEGVARAWIAGHNRQLDGRPIDRIATAPGLADVLAYLQSRQAPR